MKNYVGTTTGNMDWSVTVEDGETINLLNPRTDLVNHSPDGFAWGYEGSGPAQLALALLADATGDDVLAMTHYQTFKRRFVASLDKDSGWSATSEQILAAVEILKDEFIKRSRDHFSWGPGDVEHLS